MAAGYKIQFTAGAAFDFTITYKDSAGAAIDITGATFSGKVRATSEAGSDELIDFSSGVTISDAANGVVAVAFANADTSAYELTGLRGVYEISMLLGGARIILIPPSEFALNWRLSA